MGYSSDAQRKAVHATKADGGKGNPNKKSPAKLSKNKAEVKKKRIEEKTKRIAIRQGEKTERVKAKNSPAKKLLNGSPLKKYTQPSLVLDKSMSANPAKEIADTIVDKVEGDKKKQDEIYAGFDNPIAMKSKSPAMRKLSASCKAAARAKFDVYPSAYANMWASKQQGKGKC